MKAPALRELLERYFNRKATGKERKRVAELLVAGEIDQVTADVLDSSFKDFENDLFRELMLEEEEPLITDVAKKIKIGIIDPGQDEETVRRALDGIDNPDLLEQPVEEIRLAKERVWRRMWSDEPPIVQPRIHMPEQRRWQMAATITIALIASVILYGWQQRDDSQQTDRTVAPWTRRTVYLSDGTRVVLQGQSILTYAKDFGADGKREVTLTGEAFFDVQHDASRPFRIHSLGTVTQVLGTAFNVRANPSDTQVQVTVLRGLVQVGDEKGTIYNRVYPDQQLTVNRATADYTIRSLDADLAVLWKEPELQFADVTLEEAVARISARFDVVVTIDNPVLKKCRVHATFHNDGLTWQYVLDALTKTRAFSYRIRPDGSIVVTGEGCLEKPSVKL